VYSGGKQSAFTASYALQIPAQFKLEREGTLPFTLHFNRDKAWLNGKELTAAQVVQQKEGAYVAWITSQFPLRDKTLTLTLLGETVVNGRPALGVKITSKGHRDTDIYFDKETGLMAKTVTRVVGMASGAAIERETFRMAYKEFDGIPVAMKYVIKQGGKTLFEGEVTEWHRDDHLDDKVFTPAPTAPKSGSRGSDAGNTGVSMEPRLESVQPVLMSRDVIRSIHFYEKLGFTLVGQDEPNHPKYARSSG
jgi:hypothetical protein